MAAAELRRVPSPEPRRPDPGDAGRVPAVARFIRATAQKAMARSSTGRVQLLEAAGAVSLVVGFTVWLGAAAGWIAAGLALLGKSLEWDLRAKP